MTGRQGTGGRRTIAESLDRLLVAARARSDAGDWAQAIAFYRRAEAEAPGSPEIKHNLALAYLGGGDVASATKLATTAVQIAPRLWQSRALLARMARAEGDVAAAEGHWRAVLAHDPGNGTALLGLADLALNEFGDAAGARSLVAPLLNHAANAGDAELTSLMASVYLGDTEPRSLSARIIDFSRRTLRLPLKPIRPLRVGRRRVGLMSPLFHASPVYYLTLSTWTAIAREHDLVFFSRGSRDDGATEQLRALGSWIDVANLDAPALADAIAAQEIDVLFDLGGWSDVIGLRALSAKPAARMFKWVGGQSVTTGLPFDGWIGDEWQCPADAQSLYSEPLIQIAGGYVDYSPPAYLAGLRELPRRGVALVGNPVKIVGGTIGAWPGGVDRVTLIDRRYAHEATRERVTHLLGKARIAVTGVIVPEGHEAYLRAVAGHEAIVNTQPYSAGLTAVEAHALGVAVLAAPGAGPLFCSRHHLSHRRTGGRNRALAPQMLALIAR